MNGVTREGYTFQTALGSMGLNHMNGRVEDAVTGVFLSPDPYVPDPDNTQSFNRYSYVNNNPLTLIDPTGFDDGDPSYCAEDGSGCNVFGKLWDLGTQAGNFLTNFWADVKSFFGFGGSPHLSAYQQKVSNAGLQSAQNLQGAPAGVSLENGWRYDFPAGTDVPQVTAIPEVTVTGQYMGPGPLTTPQPTLEEFAEGVAVEQEDLASLKQLPGSLELDNTSYMGQVGQSLARSGPKAASVALVAANFVPLVGVAADIGEAALVARGAALAFGGLSRAAPLGVRSYGVMAAALRGTGLQAHHLIEQRFATLMGQNVRQMLSVAVTPAEHQAFTNAWRAAIPYGAGTANATRQQVLSAARQIYANYPAILQGLGL
jgi:RHS repeat-associated protein